MVEADQRLRLARPAVRGRDVDMASLAQRPAAPMAGLRGAVSGRKWEGEVDTVVSFVASGRWRAAYPGAAAGVLAMSGVANPEHHPALDERKQRFESELRARFAGRDAASIREIPQIQAYNAYYKQFKKTYHVQLQLESVALKGKSIPRVAALVEAMFISELKDLLLTAGHDLDAVQGQVRLDTASGDERYTLLNGQEQTLKAGDMMMADDVGVISSVLYGPDQRTRIVPHTRRALFAVYAAPGIGEDAVRQHLEDIQANVLLISPQAEVDLLQTIGAD